MLVQRHSRRLPATVKTMLTNERLSAWGRRGCSSAYIRNRSVSGAGASSIAMMAYCSSPTARDHLDAMERQEGQ